MIDSVAVAPVWPYGRDSTIVRFTLPHPLPPGDSMVVTMDWDARTSIPPRRQGRRGRQYDFAQWYPKVVVYDKYGWEEHALYPAGEFYGEFGDFFVKLDVPKDQVIGATGVPVCGDPGWQGANRGDQPGSSRQRQQAGDLQEVDGDRPGACPGCRMHRHGELPRRYASEPAPTGRTQTSVGRPRRPQFRHVDVARLSLRRRRVERDPGPRALPAGRREDLGRRHRRPQHDHHAQAGSTSSSGSIPGRR